MEKKVSIIILNYKNAEDTLECVKSLKNIDYENYDIIVVDNNSPDDSYTILKEKLPDYCLLMSSGKNGGFAYGNNVGIKYAMSRGTEYVLLLNNDTLVEKDFLLRLIECFEKNENTAISTGKIYYEAQRDKIWYAGGEIDWNRFYGYHYNYEKYNDIANISFASGCLMLIKAEVFKKVGMLPKEYFMYYEDVDFCASVLEAGYDITYNPMAVIYHKVGASIGEEESPFAVEWNTRNRLKFIKKYSAKLNFKSYIKLIAFFYITRVIKAFSYIFKGRSDKFKALLKGICK